MKSTKLFGAIFFSCILILTSCTKSTEDLTSSIPSDAFMVVNFDAKTLLKKSEFKPFENENIKAFFAKKKENSGADNQKKINQLEAFLKNPNSSGVDFLDDCFLYSNQDATGIIWRVDDEKKLKEIFIKIFDLPESEIVEEDGISIIKLERRSAIGWTQDKVIILFNSAGYSFTENNDGLLEILKKQLKQSSSESINTNPSFAKFIAERKDISLFYNYESISC